MNKNMDKLTNGLFILMIFIILFGSIIIINKLETNKKVIKDNQELIIKSNVNDSIIIKNQQHIISNQEIILEKLK